MKKPEVLIVGAGIAGLALAYWLSRVGYRPTVIEHARQLRSGGNAIVVKGPAIPVAADRMGILPQLRGLATRNRSLTLLDPGGRRILQLPLTSDEAPTVEVTRADLSEVLHRSAQTEAEFLFDEWAYAQPYRSEQERRDAFPRWLHSYNHHRGHTALAGQPPASRVPNLTGLYT